MCYTCLDFGKIYNFLQITSIFFKLPNMCLIFHARGSKYFFAGQSDCVEWSVKSEELNVKSGA